MTDDAFDLKAFVADRRFSDHTKSLMKTLHGLTDDDIILRPKWAISQMITMSNEIDMLWERIERLERANSRRGFFSRLFG